MYYYYLLCRGCVEIFYILFDENIFGDYPHIKTQFYIKHSHGG